MSSAYLTRDYDPTIPLIGGQWVNVRGIMRWQPDPGTAPLEDDPLDPLDHADAIACPYCGAKPHQACQTTGGKNVADHATRIAPRRCRCGGPISPKRRICDDCTEVAQATIETPAPPDPFCERGHALALGARGRYKACRTCARAAARAKYAAAKESAA